MSNTYLAAIATTILHLHPPQPPPFFFTSRHNSTILCYYHTLWFYFSWRQQFLHVLIRPFHPQQQPQFDQSDRRPSAQPLNRWASSAGSEPKNSHFKAQWASSSSSSFSPFFQSPMSNVFNFYSSKSPLKAHIQSFEIQKIRNKYKNLWFMIINNKIKQLIILKIIKYIAIKI